MIEESLSPLLLKSSEFKTKEALPFILGKLFQPLYLKYRPRVKGTVFVLTKVHSDGYGDWLALLKSAWALRKMNPGLEFELIYTHARALPEVDTKGLLLHPFLEHPERPVLEPILEGQKAEGISAEAIMAEAIYDRLQKGLALVHVALALNTFDNPLLAPESLYFAEAGNFLGFEDSARYNWFSMGLGPLEEGLFMQTRFKRKDTLKRALGYLPHSEEQAETFKKLLSLLYPGEKIKIIEPRKAPSPTSNFNA